MRTWFSDSDISVARAKTVRERRERRVVLLVRLVIVEVTLISIHTLVVALARVAPFRA